MDELTALVLEAGRGAGIDAIGITTAEVLEPARTVIPVRKSAGLAGSMNFTYRNPERSSDPRRAMPEARSIVAAALGYRRQTLPKPVGEPAGRVARYAWHDFYRDLGDKLAAVSETLKDAGWRAQIHLDNNNLVDRNVAHRAGLGWYGKNANLLLPGRGSWYVLGGVLTDAVLQPTGAPVADGCGPCRSCIDDCPTDAIVGPGMVDARRCLAWLVQGPGAIPPEFREAVGDRLYGCDDCQEVCPPNRGLEHQVEAAPAEPDSVAWVELLWVLDASDEELLDRLGRWYIADRDPDVIRRTALVALGNAGDRADQRVVDAVVRALSAPSALVRGHAVWAARRLGLDGLVDPLQSSELDPEVRAELERPVARRPA